MDIAEFDSELSIESQKAYCEEKNYPNFSPRTGICCRCKKNIYFEYKGALSNTGINVNTARNSHILDCPHCNMSYCD